MIQILRPALSVLVVTVLGGCAAVDQISAGVESNLKAQFSGQSNVIGSVEVIAPGVGWVTCFKDNPGASFSTQPITSPTQAKGFPALIVTKAGVAASGQCSELIQKGLLSGGGMTAGVPGGGSRPADYRTIQATELAGFFERNPQPGAGKVAEWPRVAITLVEAPPWRYELPYVRFASGQIGPEKPEPGFGCWKFKARIWTSMTVSKEVAPFHYCSGDPMRIPAGIGTSAYQVWTGLVGTNVSRETRGSTGITRTDGPVFPDTPLPTTLAYQRANFGNSFTGRVVSGVLLATGVSFENFQEHRLWLNVDPAIAPQ